MDATNLHARSVRTLAAAMLRTALPPAVIAIVAGAMVSWLAVGTAGIFGALVGGVVAAAASLATILMMWWSASLPVATMMAIALGGFALKMLVLLGVMVALQGVDSLHPMSLALTFLATVLVWVAAEVVAFRRTKIPTVIIGD